MLDVGCGTGRYSIPLDRAGFVVFGIDFSQTALRLLPSHLIRIVADVQRLPLVSESFDALTCYGVFQHLQEEERAYAATELFRVLKDKGIAFVEVVGVQDMRYGFGTQEEEDTFIRQGIRYHYFSASELSKLFVTSGFTVLTLKNQLSKKCYHGVQKMRHKISLIAQRP